jgi:uncharacterized protein with beta-barrel porin domain
VANANPGTYYLNVTNILTLAGSVNYFDLTDATLTSTPEELLSWTTNALATNSFTTNQFGIVGLSGSQSSYALSISNNTLYIALNTLFIASGSTVTVNKTESYPGVTFGTNATLNITSSGNLTITTNVAVTNNSSVIDNGVFNVSNSLTIAQGSSLSGSGIVNTPVLTNAGTVTMSGMTINAQSGGVTNSGLMSGFGTINGNTVNSGTMTGSQTINGNLTSSGTLIPSGTNSPIGTITVNGNLNLLNGSTLIIATDGSTNSSINASGTAALGGTLVIAPVTGTTLNFGQILTFLTASDITGSFSSVEMPTGFRGRVKVAGDPQLEVIVAPVSYTQVAQNQNQSNVATSLNSFIPATSGDRLTVSTALDQLTASQYPAAFNALQPTIYQSMSTIAFNLANAQNMELNQRLWGQRIAEGGGFRMSGFADTMPLLQEDGGLDFKNPKRNAILQPGPDNRWGLFVDANGIFAAANSGNMLPGYNSESGGVTTGVTFRVNPVISVGAYVGYEGSYNKYNGSNSTAASAGSTITDNSVRVGGFATYGHVDGRGFYVNAMLGGAFHNYNVSRAINFPGINRTANSTPSAAELDSMLAAGYDIQKGKWTFGPIASAQFTGFAAAPFSENGAQSLDLNASGWNTASLLSSLGAHAAYTWQATHNIVVVPQISLSWQHEFMQNPYAINSSFAGGGPSFADLSNAPLRDFLYTGIGFNVQFKQIWNASVFYNASAGNKDLQSQNIFFSFGFKF